MDGVSTGHRDYSPVTLCAEGGEALGDSLVLQSSAFLGPEWKLQEESRIPALCSR